MKIDKQKITIIALSVVLFLVAQYIIIDKVTEKRQEEMLQVFQEGYEEGLTDAVTALFDQTQNCQTTTITLNNFTKEILDYSCLQFESETSP